MTAYKKAPGPEGHRRTNYQLNYSRKKRFSKAQRAILADFFGSLLMVFGMILIVILLLIVG